MEMQSQAPPRVRLCIAPDCPFRTVEAGNVPDGAVFLYPWFVVAVVILVVALRLMREPKDEETEDTDTDEEAEEADEQEIAEAIVEEENKEL